MNRQLNYEEDVWYDGDQYYRYNINHEDLLYLFYINCNSTRTYSYKYDETNIKRQLAMTGKWRIINHDNGDSLLMIEFALEYKGTTFSRVQNWYQKLFKMEGTVIDTENFTTEDVVDKSWIREDNIRIDEMYENECTCNTTE